MNNANTMGYFAGYGLSKVAVGGKGAEQAKMERGVEREQKKHGAGNPGAGLPLAGLGNAAGAVGDYVGGLSAKYGPATVAAGGAATVVVPLVLAYLIQQKKARQQKALQPESAMPSGRLARG